LIADEQGVQAFYNYFITPWLRLTGDIQWIDTGRDDRQDAVLTASQRFQALEHTVLALWNSRSDMSD
jgi:hypothetical protein